MRTMLFKITIIICLFTMTSIAGTRRERREARKRAEGEKNTVESQAISKEERLYPSYQEGIQEKTIPFLVKRLTSVDTIFSTVIEYGKKLEKENKGNIDSLTIYSDEYWKAFVTMALDDPAIYASRLLLLARENEFKRYEYVLLFAYMHNNPEKEDLTTILKSLYEHNRKIVAQSDIWVQKGIALHDEKKYDQAIKCYNLALYYWPKNDLAEYETGLSLMTMDMMGNMKKLVEDAVEELDSTTSVNSHNKIKIPDFRDHYIKATQYNPFQTFAYQARGKEAIAKMKVVGLEIEPLLKKLYTNTNSMDDLASFADACYRIEEFELAAYAYNTALMSSFNKESGFDKELLAGFLKTLRALGTTDAATFIEEQFTLLEEMLLAAKE